ncbi:metal ABC transporter ATP-binding protein [bacterium]|nr:metal ABC transporter ATP-binding protein [bacterium]
MIQVKDVWFNYGRGPVLKEVSFDIRHGDFLAIIGPNGSGKTTLLKVILGLLKPSRGRIQIMGKDLNEFSQWQKIGYVPQKATHIDPSFPVSAREVVSMGLLSSKKSSRMNKEEEKSYIQRALRMVGMEEVKNRRIGMLSGGQQQRIFIARAIVNQPHILFLDEPTTGVDAETQGHFYDMLGYINKKQEITVVLITHEIGILNKHVNRVACLNQRLTYHGSHAEFCQSKTFKKWLAEGHHVISHQH